MHNCPHCHHASLVKAGRNASGSQRFQCKLCKRYTTLAPRLNGHPLDEHEQALRLLAEGNGLRSIGRLLHISHGTVINWINRYHAQIQSPPPRPTKSETIELDELFTYVGQKKTKSISSRR
jgi:transposase-like protein